MKHLFIAILFFSTTVFADTKTMALIKNGVVEQVAVWDGDESWKSAIEDQGYSVLDVTKQSVPKDSTCSKCDGSDFADPSPEQDVSKDQVQDQKIEDLKKQIEVLQVKDGVPVSADQEVLKGAN